MILVRNVFQAKYGKGGELVALFKESQEKLTDYSLDRILTDASGRFFTVITESTYENLADFETQIEKIFSDPEFGNWFAKMIPLVENGHREFLNIES